jgi:hypothetical protein
MILLRSSGALGGINVKLANGLTRHNWFANARGVATAAQLLQSVGAGMKKISRT